MFVYLTERSMHAPPEVGSESWCVGKTRQPLGVCSADAEIQHDRGNELRVQALVTRRFWYRTDRHRLGVIPLEVPPARRCRPSLPGAFTAGAAQRPAEIGLFDEPRQMRGRTSGVAALHDEAGAPVIDDPRNVAVTRRHHRHATCERLAQDDRGPAFGVTICSSPTHLQNRRGTSEVSREQVRVHRPGEGHHVAETQALLELRQTHTFGAVADHQRPERTRCLVAHTGEDTQARVNALLLDEPTNNEDQRLTASWRRRTRWDLHGQRRDTHARPRAPEPHERLRKRRPLRQEEGADLE
jgi:hypothetical protein